MPNLLTTTQAAALLKVGVQTVQRLVRAGKIPVAHRAGNVALLDERDVRRARLPVRGRPPKVFSGKSKKSSD